MSGLVHNPRHYGRLVVSGPVHLLSFTRGVTIRESRGQGMQDVDRPAHIQSLAQPGRAGRPRVEAEPLRVVLRPERLDRIGGHRGRRRDLGQRPAVRPPEPERAVGLSIDLIALLVDRAVVPATEQSEVRERGRAALCPVTDVMPLAERQPAAREATAAVPVVERAPQRRGNRPGPGPDFHGAPVLVVPHDHAARVARQAPGRFRGNARPVLEDGLAGLIRIRQHRGVDVDHDLVALARGAGIELVVEGRLREQGQRVRLLLGHGRAVRGRIGQRRGRPSRPARWYSVSRAASSARMSRAPTSGVEPPPEHHGAVFVLVDVQRPARVLSRGLPGLGLSVHRTASPARSARRARRCRLARPSSSRSSVSGVATRVRARTFAYDSSPRARAWASSGSVASARATRTLSRAAPRSSPIRQLSQSAQERKPALQPPRASNSRIRSRRRAVAASRCADSSAISSPRRSSSATGPRVVRMCVEWIVHGEPPFHWGDATPGIRSHPGALRTGDAGTSDDFWSAPARPAIAGPVRAAGSAPARHRQSSAMPSRLGCQAENAGHRGTRAITPSRGGAELPEGAQACPQVRAERKRLAAGVQHDAAVEPLPGDFAQRSESLEIGGPTIAAAYLDAGQAAIVGLEHDVDLPGPAVGTEVKDLGRRTTPPTYTLGARLELLPIAVGVLAAEAAEDELDVTASDVVAEPEAAEA